MMRKAPKVLSHGETQAVVAGSYDTASTYSSIIGVVSGAAIGASYAVYLGTGGGKTMSPKSVALFAAGGGALGWVVGAILFSLFTVGTSD